jgi:hypothetical protein
LALRQQPVKKLALILFMTLAFLFQSYAAQTHIHLEADGITLAKVAPVTKLDSKSGAPTRETPDNCPLCQFLYGGQHVPPSVLIFFLPSAAVSVIEPVLALLPHYDAVSHSWRGRAPPQS